MAKNLGAGRLAGSGVRERSSRDTRCGRPPLTGGPARRAAA